MEMPFAWAIYDGCTSLTPGGPRNCQQSGAFQRYDLMNIYATVTVGEWDWHLVGPRQWTCKPISALCTPAARRFRLALGRREHLRAESGRL